MASSIGSSTGLAGTMRPRRLGKPRNIQSLNSDNPSDGALPGTCGPKAAISSAANSAGGAPLIQSTIGCAASGSPNPARSRGESVRVAAGVWVEQAKSPGRVAAGDDRGPPGRHRWRPTDVDDPGFGRSGDLGHTVQVALRQVCAWPGTRPAPTRARPATSLERDRFRRLQGCVRATRPTAGVGGPRQVNSGAVSGAR